MEKLTETINAVKISKSLKDAIIKIAEAEEIHIQQVVRRLLKRAVENYNQKNENEF
jgi:hypothetical protein